MKWQSSDTPDYAVVTPQTARLMIDEVEELGGTDNDPQPFKIDVTFRVSESIGGFDGFVLRKRFWLGTQDDPKCELPQTRRERGFVSYKQFLKAAGVTPTGDTQEEAELLRGTEVMGRVTERSYIGKDGDKKMTNNVVAFWKVGTKEVALTSMSGGLGTGNGLDTSAPLGRTFTATQRATFSDDE